MTREEKLKFVEQMEQEERDQRTAARRPRGVWVNT